jgi:ubiquinol-cytochrome c reductase cytochrome c1 subunit
VIKRQLVVFIVFITSILQVALSASIALLPVRVDVQDQARLQHGAQLFINYCSGCHSLRYLRYDRMAKDLGLTNLAGELDLDLLVNNLIFTGAKIADPIQNSMPAAKAKKWFGAVPPDLSLIAKERGAAWIYTFLKSFYEDNSHSFGINNLLVPEVAMPNVLGPLAGRMRVDTSNHLTLVEKGEMSQQQFDKTLEDLVSFLVYVGEPVQLLRYRMGIKVISFLSILLIFVYLLSRHVGELGKKLLIPK